MCIRDSHYCIPIGGVDFIQETALIRFDPMNTEPIICERIQLINDNFFEETEEFFVDLSSLDPVVTFGTQSASVFIVNDDSEFMSFLLNFVYFFFAFIQLLLQ